MIKLPRTLHIEGSRMQDGEVDKDAVKFSSLTDKFLVIEEKVDGTGVGISFDNDANISIQTRGHVVQKGFFGAKQFAPLHTWADANMDKLWELISDRYILFGEWCYAKHTIFYNNLCDYFLESDIYDRQLNIWLSTSKRQELISRYGGDIICSVPILKIGRFHPEDQIKDYVQPSFYKTEKWKQDLESYCGKFHYDYSQIIRETDDSILSEGLYIKHEDRDKVIGRFKYVRSQFLETILRSRSHYKDRAIVPNIVTNEANNV